MIARSKGPRTRVVTSRPSKGGCHTCRIRKIKCDQTKPNCNKCTSTGRTCDGYPKPSPTKTTPPPNIRIIAPASLSPFAGDCREQIATPFEQNAFRRFIEHDIPIFCLVLPATEWLQVILAQAYREPAVVSAVVAVSVATNSYQNILHYSMARRLTSMSDERSLMQYHKATSLLSRYLRSPNAGIEPVLACCLLFTIIEGAQDNQVAALSHLRLGLQMLRDHGESLDTSPAAILLKAFVALVGDSIDDGRRSIVGQEGVPEVKLCMTLSGSCFDSLAQSRGVLDRIVAEASDFQARLVARADALISAHNNVTLLLSTSARLCVAHSLARVIAARPEYSDERARLIEVHNAWHHGFLQLYKSLSDEDKRRSTLAQLKHFSSSFAVRTSATIHELHHDQNESEFVHMLDLAELYIDQGTRLLRPVRKPISFTIQRSFSVEYAILPALLLIAVKSRHRATRKRAIDVLVSSVRHEAHQYSFWLAVRAELAMGIEEERAKALHLERVSPSEEVGKASIAMLTTTTRIPEQARILDAVFDEVAAPFDMKVLVTRFRHEEESGGLELAQYVADVSGAVPLFRLESQLVLPFSCE